MVQFQHSCVGPLHLYKVTVLSSWPFCTQTKKCQKSVNKKVLLREHKRPTERSVSSTPYAVLSWRGTYLGWGVPTLGYPSPVLTWWGGTYLGVSQILTWPGGTYLGQGYLPWGTPIWTWLGYPPSGPGRGTPPRCEQTENITFPHPSDAVGKNLKYLGVVQNQPLSSLYEPSNDVWFCLHCRILRLSEDGLLDKWKKVYWPPIKQCDIKSAHKILTLADVQGLFYLVCGSLLLAFTVLMIESGSQNMDEMVKELDFLAPKELGTEDIT